MRFNNLTAARFVAAVLVFLHHSTPAEYVTLHSHFWHNFFLNGYVGVSFFFVLSGFVIAASSMDKLARPSIKRTAAFYWNRLARIIPLWALVSSPLIWYAYTHGDPALPWFLTFTQSWLRDINLAFSVLAVAWTLSVEMFFYAIFPVLAVLCAKMSERVAGTTFVAVGLGIGFIGAAYFVAHPELSALAWTDSNGPHFWLYQYPLSRAGEFIAGIGVFLLIRSGALIWDKRSTVAALSVAGLVLFETMGRLPIGGAWWIVPYAPIFASIVALLARLDQLGVTIKAPMPILLGESSFAFYLIHQYYGKGVLFPALLPLGFRIAQVGTFIFVLCTSVGLFLLVESPIRKCLVRLFHTKSTAPSPVVVERLPIADQN